MSIRISLCMIVKNEQANIQRCLNSAVNSVDEIIIVDTGSTDNTCDIARTFGAKVYSFTWNHDFSAARNMSLQHASGDWILFLDADEELQLTNQNVLRELAEGTHEGFFVKIINYIGAEGWIETAPDLVFRFFRNNPQYRFEGAIHEQIVNEILKQNSQAGFRIAQNISIQHYGYLDQQIIDKDKKNRNLAIIKTELDKKPNDVLLQYHYGVELFRSENYSEAAQVFTKAANNTNPQTIYFPKLIRYVVMSHQNAQEYPQALHALKLGLQFFPDYADLYYYKGLIHLELKAYAPAFNAFKQAVTMPEQQPQYASFGGVKGFRSYYHLGNISEHFLNYEEALKYYLLSLRDNPDFKHSLDRMIEILNPVKYPEDTQESMEIAFDFCNDQAKLMLAETYRKKGSYRLCLAYLEQLETSSPQIDFWKTICLLQEERHFEALRNLSGFSQAKDSTLYPLIKLNELFSFWVQNKKQKALDLITELRNLGLSQETGKIIDLIYWDIMNKAFAPLNLGDEGWALLLDLLKRLVYLKHIETVEKLLKNINLDNIPESGALELTQTLINHSFLKPAKELLLKSLPEVTNPEIYELLGDIDQELHNYPEAECHFEKAIQIQEDEPRYYVKLQTLYQTWRLEVLTQAIDQYPDENIFAALARGLDGHE